MAQFKRVYVVASKDAGNNKAVFTLSEDPNVEGWETDSGVDGYGLTKEKAMYYADCINFCMSVIDRPISITLSHNLLQLGLQNPEAFKSALLAVGDEALAEYGKMRGRMEDQG